MKERIFIVLMICIAFVGAYAQNEQLTPPTDLTYNVGADFVELSWSGPQSVVSNSFNLNWGIPTNFQNIDNDDDGESWQEISEAGFLNTGAAVSYMSNTGNPEDVDNWLITIPYDITEDSHLILHVKSLDSGMNQDFEVLVNSQGIDVSDFDDVIYSGSVSDNEMQRIDIDLSNYGESQLFFAFRHTNSQDSGLVLDEIWLTNLQEPEERNERDDLLYGFNIYKDNVLVGFNTGQMFFDFQPLIGTSEYYVTSLYNNGESQPSTSVLVEFGTVVESDESFEDGLLPDYWQIIDNGSFPFWKVSTSEPNSGDYSVSISAYGPQDDWLITPMLSPSEMESTLSFYAKADVFEPNTAILDVWVSTESNNIEDFTDLLDEINFTDGEYQEYSYSLVNYIDQQIYIAYQFMGDQISSVYMDDITHPPIVTPNNSIAVSDITVEEFLQVGVSNEVTCSIINKGSYPIDGYVADLVDSDSGEILASYQGGFVIPGMNEEISITYIPQQAGIKNIHVESSLTGDPYTFDNASQIHQVCIRDENDSVINLGTDNQVELGLPFNMLWPYNLTQTIYPSSDISDLQANQSQITGLSYYYANEYSPEPLEITIWLGETANTNLDAGWESYENLTQVYNGPIEMVTNEYVESMMAVEFDQVYNYRGQNLVIMIYRQDSGIHIGDNNLLCSQSASQENVSLVFFDDDLNPDPQNPPETGSYCFLSQNYPNISFIYSDGPTANEENENISPAQTVIKGNYPNPFNPVTSISFSLAKDSFVEIEIYNLKGQLVKSLVNERLISGNHNVVWDGENSQGQIVSSGIYFSKLKTDGQNKSLSKMILMK